MKILDELWYGNITPNERYIPPKSQFAKQIDLIVRNEEKLTALLSDEAKEIFEKLQDCQSELSGINEREAFVSGFRLGAKIIIEVMEGMCDIPSIDD